MPRVGYTAVVVLIGLPSALPTSAEPETGMLCVIPDPPGCCDRVTDVYYALELQDVLEFLHGLVNRVIAGLVDNSDGLHVMPPRDR